MDIHYNAFISYRHHPQDIKVAETIHRALERFKVPKSLKKEGKCIERIFRDKEELPITSSLTDTITMALRNSDYQIVICSTHLKDSYWVQREIETFLQTHSKDKVLTVLVDGDNPYDVIPEILTYNEVVDPVTGEVTRESIEPLSCDWRMPKRKAMKTELPRLAAVLLGCTYDDLIQRQKQYRQRRLLTGISIGMAASLALAGYFMYTNIQSQENLNQSLRNQSQYLASAAQDSLNNGDRMTAIALALAGLPSEENPRPYVPEAEQVLAEAIGLYQSEEVLSASGAMATDSIISDFVISDDAKYVYIVDENDELTIFDADTFMPVGRKIQIDGVVEKMLISEKNLLVLKDSSARLHCFSTNGDLLWSLDNIADFAFFGETKDRLLCIQYDYANAKTLLLQLNPNTGESIVDTVLLQFSEDEALIPAFCQDHYRPSQEILLKCLHRDMVREELEKYSVYLASDTSDSLYGISRLDCNSGIMTPVFFSDSSIYDICQDDNGRLYALISGSESTEAGVIMNLITTDEYTDEVHCYDMESGRKLWRTEVSSHVYGAVNSLDLVPDSDWMMCIIGNMLRLMDRNSGKILDENLSLGMPVFSDTTNNATLFITEDGALGHYIHNRGKISTFTGQFLPNLRHAAINGGFYLQGKESLQLVRYNYRYDEPDSVFTQTDDSYLGTVRICDRYLTFLRRDTLRMYDMQQQQLLWSADADVTWDLIDFSSDESCLYLGSNDEIITVRCADGTMTVTEIPERFDGFYCYSNDDMVLNSSGIWWSGIQFETKETKEAVVLIQWQPDNGTFTRHLLPLADQYLWEYDASSIQNLHLGANLVYGDDSHLIVHCIDGSVQEWDINAGNATILATGIVESPAVAYTDNHSYIALASEQELQILDDERNCIASIPLDGLSVRSLFFYEEDLLALCNDYRIHRFNLQGNCLSRIGLALSASAFSSYLHDSYMFDTTWTVTDQGDLVLFTDSYINVIDCNTWSRRAYMESVVAFHNASSTALIQESDCLLRYRLLTTEEVIARAKSELGNYTLTDTQKHGYGIE